jgi:hypothetical protein
MDVRSPDGKRTRCTTVPASVVSRLFSDHELCYWRYSKDVLPSSNERELSLLASRLHHTLFLCTTHTTNSLPLGAKTKMGSIEGVGKAAD